MMKNVTSDICIDIQGKNEKHKNLYQNCGDL